MIEFRPAAGIPHAKVMDLLNSDRKESKGKKGKGDGWNQQVGVNQQVLSFGGMVGGIFYNNSGFNKALKDKISESLDSQQIHTDFMPTVLSEGEISQLDYESVYYVDQRKINSNLPIRYFINIAP